MNLILTSDFPSSRTEAVVARIQACDAQARIAWIAPQASSRLLHWPRARLQFRACGFRNLEFVDAGVSRAEQRDLVGRFDAIYVSGGIPMLYRQRLAESGLGDQIRAFAATGRLIIAASGGMMQLTANVSLFRLLTVPLERVLAERAWFEALGLVDFEVLPHLNRHDQSLVDTVTRYAASIGREVIALDDGAAIVYDGTGVPTCFGRVVRHGREGGSDWISQQAP
jgi:peptidase E